MRLRILVLSLVLAAEAAHALPMVDLLPVVNSARQLAETRLQRIGSTPMPNNALTPNIQVVTHSSAGMEAQPLLTAAERRRAQRNGGGGGFGATLSRCLSSMFRCFAPGPHRPARD